MQPEVEHIGSKVMFSWRSQGIQALVRNYHEHRDGRVTAEVTWRKADQGHILMTQLNLLSSQTRRQISKELEEIHPIGQWEVLIEQLCVKTIELFRQGEPIVFLDTNREIHSPEYLIYPLIYRNQPNLIFGEGGTGKSYLALALALLCQAGYTEPLDLNLRLKKANVFYLDYETTEEETTRRLKLLARGFAIPEASIMYRECRLPLVEDIGQIEELVLEHKPDFIIIDSLGVAAAQNLSEAQTATAFYAALRRIKATVLLISHMAKEPETKKPTPFGSVYWRNIARNEWFVRRNPEAGEDILTIGLFHTKNNLGKLMKPQGFTFRFEDDAIKVESCDVSKIGAFLENLTLKEQIREVLRHGKMTEDDIAEVLGAKKGSVHATLYDNPDIFVKLGKKEWGLKAPELL